MKIFLSFALGLCCACSEAQVTTRYLGIIGSSTSACFGTDYQHCWVNLLDQHYDVKDTYNTLIHQVAKPGYSPYEGMPTGYIPPPGRPSPDPQYNITAMLSKSQLPAVVIVNYPSNGFDTYTVKESMFCLRSIYKAVVDKNIRCYITTTQPRSSPASFATSEVRKKMAEIKDSVIKEFGNFSLNFWDTVLSPADSTILPLYNAGDNIHLNDKGHAAIFNQVIKENIFGVALAMEEFSLRVKENNNTDDINIAWQNDKRGLIKMFDLQKSNDGATYVNIYSVAGSDAHYNFTDHKPFASNNFYRLKIEFFDGHIDFSPVATIFKVPRSMYVQKLFCANNRMLFDAGSAISQTMMVTIFQINGAIVYSGQKNIKRGETHIKLDNLPLAKGMYYLRCTGVSTAEVVTLPFMVQ